MLLAIIVAVLAAVIAIVVIAAALAVRANRSTPSVGTTKGVSQLDTVGVGTSPFERRTSARAARDGEVTVGSSEDPTAAKKPSDGLGTRFAAVGALAAGIFAVLASKLWTMQILGNSEYANAAEQNLYTTVKTPAPRGCIYDTNGVPLAVNRPAQAVLADPEVADNRDVVRRLSTVLGVPVNVLFQRIKDASGGAQSLRVLGQDVRLRDVAFIAEHADAFPGVTVEERSLREYPYGALAAHVLGYTSNVTPEIMENKTEGREILSIDTVGTAGVEATYDSYLAGEHGESKVMVDANGRRISVMSNIDDSKGSDVYLTIDARAQYVADRALADLIAPREGIIGTGKGCKGAVVALDVTDGSVVVMSSFPTFDPTNFTGAFSQDLMDKYNSEEAYAPLNNNVVSGQFMAASTFKAFTSLAGLEYGFASESSSWNCTGEWDGFDTGVVQKCWNHAGHGTLDLYGGIVNSCDTVFYEIGKAFYDHGPEGSGDLPDNVPSEAVWRGGDYTNMIIGQGDVLVTPLQIACAYAGAATGTIMRPHLLKEVRNSAGETVVTFEPEVSRTPEVTEAHLTYVRDALHDMVRESHSVAPLFEEAGIDAAGKSGTGEKQDQNDTAWFVAYAPFDDPKYVVACVVEQGGGGSDTAAPVVAEVMAELMADAAGTSTVTIERVAGSPGESVEITVDSGGRED